jgi:hypothetical protein
MREQKNDKTKSVSLSLILFLLSVLMFWTIWFLKAYAWLLYRDELIVILLIFQIIIIIIMILSGIGHMFAVNYQIIMNKAVKRYSIKYPLIILCIVIHLCILALYGGYGYTVSTLSNIIEKESYNDNYFITIKNKELNRNIKIECDINEYNKVEVNKDIYYMIEYRRLIYIENKGYLGKIDTEEIIDNR